MMFPTARASIQRCVPAHCPTWRATTELARGAMADCEYSHIGSFMSERPEQRSFMFDINLCRCSIGIEANHLSPR